MQHANELTISQRGGVITLIPKEDGSLLELSNWRSVTLLNVDCKIATKAIARRIEPLLGSFSNDGLINKNNRSARAFYVFEHFFAVISKTTTWNDQIQGFLENVSTRRWIFHFPSLLERRSHKSSSQIIRPHCTSWTNWNNREVVEVTRSYIF